MSLRKKNKPFGARNATPGAQNRFPPFTWYYLSSGGSIPSYDELSAQHFPPGGAGPSAGAETAEIKVT